MDEASNEQHTKCFQWEIEELYLILIDKRLLFLHDIV